jgi:hypothetical protein
MQYTPLTTDALLVIKEKSHCKGRVLRTALELQAPNHNPSEKKIAILPFVGFRIFSLHW